MTSGIIKCPSVNVLEILQWYDNEWGYSNRCVDLAVFMGKKLRQSNPAHAASSV